MELIINSSALTGAEYDEHNEVLTLHWRGGSYEYYGVPLAVALELQEAGSQGAYANDNIAHSYRFSRV